MNKLRSSKLGIVFAVLAMIGLITGPALAMGCCCTFPVATGSHYVTPIIDEAPRCHQATTPAPNNHCASQKQNAPSVSRSCDCPQAQAQFFVTTATSQNGVFAASFSTLPLREITFAAPVGNALPFVELGRLRPPLLSFSSFSGRAPPVC